METTLTKKGSMIVLKFIIGIVISLLMLSVFFGCFSKIPWFSSQDKSNVGQFAKELNDLKQENAKSSFLLEFSQDTAVVYFEPDADQVSLTVDNNLRDNFQVIFARPTDCKENKPCLCHFLDTTLKDEEEINNLDTATIQPERPPVCFPLKTQLELQNCALGSPNGAKGYTCENGFVIEKLVVQKAYKQIKTIGSDAHFELFGPLSLKLHRENNIITLSR